MLTILELVTVHENLKTILIKFMEDDLTHVILYSFVKNHMVIYCLKSYENWLKLRLFLWSHFFLIK